MLTQCVTNIKKDKVFFRSSSILTITNATLKSCQTLDAIPLYGGDRV